MKYKCPGCGGELTEIPTGFQCDDCDIFYQNIDLEDEVYGDNEDEGDGDYEDESDVIDEPLGLKRVAQMAIVGRVLDDENMLAVNISIKQAWLLVSAIQLAVRHPELHEPLVVALTETARQFQAAVVAVHPDAAGLLEMGWDAQYDV